MAKEAFRVWNPQTKTKTLLAQIIQVVNEYHKLGYNLTLRQLYYQLVASSILPNKQSEYAKLSTILNRARLAGIVDWDIIEDRVRVPKKQSEWDSLSDLISSAIYSFRLPRWSDQPEYIELWTEKDALTSILEPIAMKYHIPLVVNRGYSSASAMYRAGKRLKKKEGRNKKVSIIYLGDYDPSGLDMDRDIQERLREFRVMGLSFTRIGLTQDQIQQYNPPPNPAKFSDPRAFEYIRKHGKTSWEVDALKPQDLDHIVSQAIESHMDMSKYNAWKIREQILKEKLEHHGKLIEQEMMDED